MVSRGPRPPPLGRVRFASAEDAPVILDLITDSVSKTFRVECTNDITYLIENSILSICQLDSTDGIVGFLSARDYPLIPSVHPSAWEEFIWTKYKSVELKSRNTLFIHLLCWDLRYSREAVDNMLKTIFMHDPYVHYIAMYKSDRKYPQIVPGNSRAEASFRRIQVMEKGMSGDQLPSLFIADRSEVSPRLRVRRAVEEDNDDLVPIIENHAPRLREMYGEFYISELISRHPESDRVLLVCEHKEVAVGMMCLNTTVNYEALEESFVLSPFGGLRHLDGSSQTLPKDNMMAGSILSLNGEPPQYSESTVSKVDTARVKISEHGTHESSIVSETQPLLSPRETEQIVEILLEDEALLDLEYDIVNINTEHLRVPEYLYSELAGTPDVIEKVITEKNSQHESASSERAKKDKSSVPHTSSGLMGSRQEPKPVRYHGSPNAFLIELFTMHPDYDERYGFDVLEAAFELFPNRDYCILCLPSNQPAFPLLEHFTLVTPIGNRMRFINESLFVAHVNSVRGNMRVRPGEHYDKNDLRTILENTPRMETLLELFNSSLGSKTLTSFVLLSENQPFGFVVIGPLEDGTAVRTQYDLEPEPRRPGTDGAILAGVMSPALEPHTRWFMRELMRQSRFSTLFWICRLFARGDASPVRNLMSLAGHMNPVHPRQSVPNISGNKDLDKIFRDLSSPFALWMLERPLTSLPKVYVNNSIVVVGASRTGLAFLETLIMGPTSQYLTFSNVTLVSEHGLPTVADCLKAADICVPRYGRFTDRYIKSVPFYYYVDVISAVMIGIDRKRKCIHLKGGSTKYYDELVLTCGQQFQHPDYLDEALDLAKEVEKGKPCDRILMDNPKYQEDRVPPPPELPDNVFLVNSLYEANVILIKLMRMISDKAHDQHALSEENQVVVYGDCIEAYCCIAALLELGIKAKDIVFVEPFPATEDATALRVNCFNDEIVDARVQARLHKLNIRVLRQCHLAGWHQEDNEVKALDLMTPLHAISLKCFALFYYGLQAIDLHAFKAINESGLVYDGGLVVSPTFETNDRCIYGAGTCVSYSRRLYATRRLHRNYCSEDIGEALAKLFLRKLDPFVMGAVDTERSLSDALLRYSSSALGFRTSSPGGSSTMLNAYRRWQPVMKFESPIVQSATFPGPLFYMKLRKSGRETPMAVQQILPNQGHTLVTDKDGNYFRLRLNILHVVEDVTCLSKKPFSSDVLSQLFGKHEAFFNKLLTRYLKNEIKDFYDFFTQPWMSAMYQETFRELIDDIDMQDVGTIFDLLKSKFTLYNEMSSEMKFPTSQSIMSVISSGGLSSKSMRLLGTFRSVIERFISRTSASRMDKSHDVADMPIKCGQDKSLRKEATTFWEHVSGERIVSAHLAMYLDRNSVINPHYAAPRDGLSK
ncbi:cilia- and flagella-associated protein 61-like [Anticarsia gemmatalis]|uniref:cilia- and flagella-associated protein 61-like n=1 Tax=Anticarsia gemmatalis TaxID=129554 RepID=UPI003F762EF9